MKRTPWGLLQHDSPPGLMIRAPLRATLSSPWGWPRDEALARCANAWGFEAPSAPSPGETAGVVVVGGEGLVVRIDRHGSVPVLEQCRAALATALHVAREQTPWLVDPSPLTAPVLRVHTLHELDAPPLAAVDGASFGVAFFAAFVSALARTPLRSDVLATATLDINGRVGPVDGLASKLRAVAEQALGVEAVLVAEAQVAEARGHAATLPRGLRIIGAATAHDALRHLCEGLESGPARAALEPTRETVRRLYAYVRGVPQLPRWHSVVRAADALCAAEPHLAEPRVIRAIAQRHTGEPCAVLPWDDDAVDRFGNAYVAQLVQGAGDAGDACAEEFVRRGLERARSAPEEPGSLMALGACGRVLAMLRRYDEAEACVREATRRWLRRDEPAAASMPVCEWLRVSSVRGDAVSFDEAREQLLRVGTSVYTDLALIAGLVRLGRADEARSVPERVASSEQEYARRSLQRWRARVWAASGDASRAATLRRSLEPVAGSDDGPAPEALFARLDAARERTEGIAEALEAIEARGPQGIAWLGRGCDEAERARRYADEGPY